MPVAHIANGKDKLDLAFLDEGKGPVVLLIHGFASNRTVNWVNTGWVKQLTAAGYRFVALDNRGHGESTKFYDETDYALEKMAGDALALMDELGVEKFHVIGYSMGSRIAATLAMGHGDRLGKVVLSGGGWTMVDGSGDWTPVRDALLADTLDQIKDQRGWMFRVFADQTGSDRHALAACVKGVRQLLPLEGLRKVSNPVMVAVGTEDEVAGSGEKLAEVFPDGTYLPIPRRDHMKAVGDKAHIEGVIAFLGR